MKIRIAVVLCMAMLLGGVGAQAQDAKLVNGYRPAWWKEAVVYQIYPRSFKDSNGDGIGDLKGITSKLDYIKGLGVDVIWLSPHFDSPNADNGYDIRDYRKVMTEFGTMADFDTMLAQIKKRHMRLIIDLVVNHTSDEHRWFVESSKSKDNPYRDFYIWRAGKADAKAPNRFDVPNNYPSFFSGSAWQFDKRTDEFYLHLFAVKQPDLNWDNPKVRQEVYSLMKFWLDKGVDGFRMDVIPLISKQPGLPDITPGTDYVHQWANGPRRDEYLQEMNHDVLSKYDVMTVGEAIGISLEESPKLVDERRNELNLIFNFDAGRINRAGSQAKEWTLPDLKAIYTKHAETLDKHSWDTVFLSNHDMPRIVSSFGNDSDAFRVNSAKLLTTMLLTLRGTPFFYQGDELGMTNYPFQKIGDFDDIEVKNAYKAQVLIGQIPEADYIANLRKTSRDNSRTPMQWDATANAGFTTAAAKPWLAVNPNYTKINAAEELKDPASPYSYMAKLVKLRKETPAFVYGDYKDLDPANASVFEYTRTLGSEKYLVVLNFSDKPNVFTLPGGVTLDKLVISNEGAADGMTLKPWEARIYKF